MSPETTEHRDTLKILRMVGALSRVHDNITDRFTQARWGLTVGQMRLLVSLLPEESARTLELAHRLFTDPGTVSGLLRRLVQKNLITTRQYEADRRVQLVSLTPEGRRIRQEFLATAPQELPFLDAALRLGDQDRAELVRLLVKFGNLLIGDEDVTGLMETLDYSLER